MAVGGTWVEAEGSISNFQNWKKMEGNGDGRSLPPLYTHREVGVPSLGGRGDLYL
jgi:hypothetical protein